MSQAGIFNYAARLSGWDDASNGENISYDARGNITSRSPRYGSSGTITLTYTGDRLATRKVGTGAAVSFAHDSFARMTTDAESGLSITYNALDLPETVSMGNTLKAKYTYLSDGTKVSALDASGAGLVYRGPFTYRRSSGGTLAFESAPFDSGRLTEAGVRYHVTDHLGSVRAVIDGNASTTTYPLAGFYSVDDFAPFGVKSASSASSYLSLASTGSTVSLRDGFTGQEDQLPDFSIGYSDFGARQYSPSLSRWLVPDPMGEKYYDVSPYAYCAGNPVNMVDPDGMDWYINDITGYYTWFDRSDDIEGYTYYGPRNSLFGEGESLIDDLLIHNFKTESLYTNGFSFEISSPSKTSTSIDYKNLESGFLWDFLLNIGPEYSVALGDHPFTQALQTTKYVQAIEKLLASFEEYSYLNSVRRWSIMDAITTPSIPLQFIGSYAIRAKVSSGNQFVYTVVGDSKSRSSLFLHMPFDNPRRNSSNILGNTYQLYLWVTPLK